MDDRYIYAFVRQDITIAEQLVHTAHAAFHLGSLFRSDGGIPSLVVVGCPDAKALARVLRKLESHGIPHYSWSDPDCDYGCTAIATAPLDGAHRALLSNYRLWRYSPATETSGCALNGDGGANADVAQEREHSAFSREVASSSLAIGSISAVQE